MHGVTMKIKKEKGVYFLLGFEPRIIGLTASIFVTVPTEQF